MQLHMLLPFLALLVPTTLAQATDAPFNQNQLTNPAAQEPTINTQAAKLARRYNNNNNGGGNRIVNQNTSPYSILFAPAPAQSASDAFSNFANHVYAVSTSLIGLSYARNSNSIIALANSGFAHEALESIEAMKMARYTNNNGGAALQALVSNTPCILNGLRAAAQNPARAAGFAVQMSVVRDALILPNILALGMASGASNLLQFPATGPLMANPFPVQPRGSANLLAAQRALGCATNNY
ncbi:hypothetical protein CcCBS67573_g01171 [Chytriomyces confervae]|uniref:Uncharacterized protein n=1 Tax=Chytriomyces confervae TaxID=246404 RepID=A0A507FQ05_9FUNG|nr:hypothetical protein CcCBS67573_g01171 [Chytriomyces confervae]